MTRRVGRRPGRARLAGVAAAAALMALLLVPEVMAAGPAVIAVNNGGPGSSEANPVSVPVGNAQGQVITFTNRDKSKSTTALVVTAPGNGFSIVGNTCSGTALGPNKSCTVTVAYLGTQPSPGTTAQLSVRPKTPPPAAAIAYLRVGPLGLGDLCRYYGSIGVLNGRTFIGCSPPIVVPGKPGDPAAFEAIRANFRESCLASGYPTSHTYGSWFDVQGFPHTWAANPNCDGRYTGSPAGSVRCSENGGVLASPLQSFWKCSGVALPDQQAVDALAAQFKSECDSVDFARSHGALSSSAVPDGASLRATFTCLDPIGLEPAQHCRYYELEELRFIGERRILEATLTFTPDGKFLSCRVLFASTDSNVSVDYERFALDFRESCEANGYPTSYQARAPALRRTTPSGKTTTPRCGAPTPTRRRPPSVRRTAMTWYRVANRRGRAGS